MVDTVESDLLMPTMVVDTDVDMEVMAVMVVTAVDMVDTDVVMAVMAADTTVRFYTIPQPKQL
jgi:hypothetical protein